MIITGFPSKQLFPVLDTMIKRDIFSFKKELTFRTIFLSNCFLFRQAFAPGKHDDNLFKNYQQKEKMECGSALRIGLFRLHPESKSLVWISLKLFKPSTGYVLQRPMSRLHTASHWTGQICIHVSARYLVEVYVEEHVAHLTRIKLVLTSCHCSENRDVQTATDFWELANMLWRTPHEQVPIRSWRGNIGFLTI